MNNNHEITLAKMFNIKVHNFEQKLRQYKYNNNLSEDFKIVFREEIEPLKLNAKFIKEHNSNEYAKTLYCEVSYGDVVILGQMHKLLIYNDEIEMNDKIKFIELHEESIFNNGLNALINKKSNE